MARKRISQRWPRARIAILFHWEASLARKIFKASEVNELKSKVLITPPSIQRVKEEPPEQIEEVEELREVPETGEAEEAELREREQDRDALLEEAQKIKNDAEEQAKKIREEAEEAAFKLMQKNSIDARTLKEEAEAEAKNIIEKAKKAAEETEAQAAAKAEELIANARTEGFEEGREEGFKKGEEEVERLIERLHVIINAAIDKRKLIVENTEKQLVDLVLLIAHKVVKVISEAERKVVIENVRDALKKVRGETDITIRVNTVDLSLTTKNKKHFISLMEKLEHITIEEDSRVGPGGCIIETSFGDIDARITTQLSVLEEKIRELVPIKG
jgi:flagellar assembly protein FliH